MNPLQALYRLQELESSLDQAQARLARIESQLENNTTLQEKKTLLTERERELQQAQTRLKDLELELAGIIEKCTEEEKLLYSGQIKNPKELQDRQEEVESLKRRRSQRETEQMAALEAAELARRNAQDATAELHLVQEEQRTEHKELYDEREKLQKQMNGWLQQRKTVKAQVDPQHYKLYKKLKPVRNGIAISRLEDSTCSACRVEQNQTIVYQVRQGKDLVVCHNCGRILIEI